MPTTAPPTASASPAKTPFRSLIDQLPVAVLGLGLLITSGIIIQNILFNRRYHEQAELALLDDVADALITRMNAISASDTQMANCQPVAKPTENGITSTIG